MADAYSFSFPDAFSGSDAARRAFPVRSPDGFSQTRTTTDWIFDAAQGAYFGMVGIPANGTALPAGGMLNLANNSPLAIPAGLRGAVTLKSQAGKNATVETADSRVGIKQATGTNFTSTIVQKAGIADQNVGHPPTEGFLDFLVIDWFRPNALAQWGAIGCSNNNAGSQQQKFWGFGSNPGGTVFEVLSTATRPIPVVPNRWQQVAIHYRFDTVGGAIYVRSFYNGNEVNATAAATPVAMTPAAMTALPHANTQTQVGGNYIDSAFDGLTGRVERTFTSIAGHTLDPAEEVARNWNTLRSQFYL